MKFKAMFSSWQKLSIKIVGALLLMLVLALSAIGCTLFLSWQLEGSSAAINETGRLRMQTYRLTLLLASDAREQARQQVLLIDETLAKIGHGDPQRPLFLPPSTAIKSEFERIGTAWRGALRPSALAADTTARARQFERDADSFVGQVDQLVRLIEHDSEQRTFWLRASQLILVGMAVIGTVSMIYLMFMLIIEPVTRLRLGMQRMKERDFSVRLSVDGTLYLCLGQEEKFALGPMLRGGATDAEIEAAIRAAIELKPQQHDFNTQPDKIIRFMAQTGG